MAAFWVAGGLVFTANYLVLDLFEMYHYYPGLLPGLMPDTVLGVFLAELAFVGGFTVWLVYALPPGPGALAGTAAMLVIEVLFRRVGLFVGHIWTLWHSAALFPPYFLLVYWFRAAAERHGLRVGWLRTTVRPSLALWWAHFVGMLVYWIMAGLIFGVNFLPTLARNQALGAMLTITPWLVAAIEWISTARGWQRTLRLGWTGAGLLLAGQHDWVGRWAESRTTTY